MKQRFHLATSMLAIVFGTAPALANTASGGGILIGNASYRYEYSVSWETSAGSFSLGGTSVRQDSPSALSFAGAISTTTPQLDVDSFDLHAVFELRLYSVATGLPAAPQILPSGNPPRVIVSTGSGGGGYAADNGGSSSNFRVSNYLSQQAVSLTDGSGRSLLGVQYLSEAPTVLRFEMTEHFAPGHYLTPSNDPQCASFDCMISGQEELRITNPSLFSATLQVVSIPEPAQWATLLGGLACMGAALRRRPGDTVCKTGGSA